MQISKREYTKLKKRYSRKKNHPKAPVIRITTITFLIRKGKSGETVRRFKGVIKEEKA